MCHVHLYVHRVSAREILKVRTVLISYHNLHAVFLFSQSTVAYRS